MDAEDKRPRVSDYVASKQYRAALAALEKLDAAELHRMRLVELPRLMRSRAKPEEEVSVVTRIEPSTNGVA